MVLIRKTILFQTVLLLKLGIQYKKRKSSRCVNLQEDDRQITIFRHQHHPSLEQLAEQWSQQQRTIPPKTRKIQHFNFIIPS